MFNLRTVLYDLLTVESFTVCGTNPESASAQRSAARFGGFLLASQRRRHIARASVRQLVTSSAQLQLHVPVEWSMASQ